MSDWQRETASALRGLLTAMGQRQVPSNRDGFDEEFDALRSVDLRVRSNPDEFYSASLGSNMCKNRYHDVLPNEGTRVVLDPVTPRGDGGYINANYVDGRRLYGVPFVYIATQAPLRSTMGDFWRMVWENNSVFVVMLCNEIEGGKNKSFRYFPVGEGGVLSAGAMTVVLESENARADTVFRTLVLRTDDGRERRVFHMQHTAWPDQGVPRSSAGLMDIVYGLGRAKVATETPIVVHCSGGAGRTGVFVAMHVALGLFQMERPISVPRIVQYLKYCRSGMVQRKDQYLFLYYALLREMEKMIWAFHARAVDVSAQIAVDDKVQHAMKNISRRAATHVPRHAAQSIPFVSKSGAHAEDDSFVGVEGWQPMPSTHQSLHDSALRAREEQQQAELRGLYQRPPAAHHSMQPIARPVSPRPTDRASPYRGGSVHASAVGGPLTPVEEQLALLQLQNQRKRATFSAPGTSALSLSTPRMERPTPVLHRAGGGRPAALFSEPPSQRASHYARDTPTEAAAPAPWPVPAGVRLESGPMIVPLPSTSPPAYRPEGRPAPPVAPSEAATAPSADPEPALAQPPQPAQQPAPSEAPARERDATASPDLGSPEIPLRGSLVNRAFGRGAGTAPSQSQPTGGLRTSLVPSSAVSSPRSLRPQRAAQQPDAEGSGSFSSFPAPSAHRYGDEPAPERKVPSPQPQSQQPAAAAQPQQAPRQKYFFGGEDDSFASGSGPVPSAAPSIRKSDASLL